MRYQEYAQVLAEMSRQKIILEMDVATLILMFTFLQAALMNLPPLGDNYQRVYRFAKYVQSLILERSPELKMTLEGGWKQYRENPL